MIVKSVVLPCTTTRAFALFTERIDDWWPPERRHIAHPEAVIALDAQRFIESDPTGNVVALGAVRVWEPPERLLLDFYPGSGPERPTQVEVRFIALGDTTKVEVRHRAGSLSAELFPTVAPKYESSWTVVLQALERAAAEP